MALSSVVFADPFFAEMDRAMNRLMTGALVGGSLAGGPAAGSVSRSGAPGGSGLSAIAMDIVETPTAYELHADTPGMSPQDVKVELHEGVLTISGERKLSHSAKDAGGKVWRSERSSYAFSRAFTLPQDANADAISAAIDKGVLTVMLPKRDPPAKQEPKRIAVTSAL